MAPCLVVTECHNVLKFDTDGKIPLKKFSGVQSDVGIKTFHTWICAVYVLDYGLQDGHVKLPKWNPRSRAGIYLGQSALHASSVDLVLNPQTGHVSPRFNCVFYDHITTFSHMRNGKVASNCAELVERISEEIFPERFLVLNT